MKLFLLSILSFLFISASTLAISRLGKEEKNDVLGNSQEIEDLGASELPLLPTFTGKSPEPQLTANAIYVLDSQSQVTLYEKNPDLRVLPASTTKMVTALVSLDYFLPDEVIVVGNEVFVEGQKMGLVPGEKIMVEDLLYGLLVYSGNDAAEVLAKNYPGGRSSFVSAMNLKAKELNLENTSFYNPSGLDGNGHMTSARDLARVAIFGMKNSLFRKIVGTESTIVEDVDGNFRHKLVNLNELLGKEEGVLGVKTGWTESALENLVTYIEKDDKKIIIVVLGSQDRFGETKKLIDWVFENYEWKNVPEFSY
jgi:D-alanyl-D-alanine carboxypeptidase (penicillin-binding protein 5/6)